MFEQGDYVADFAHGVAAVPGGNGGGRRAGAREAVGRDAVEQTFDGAAVPSRHASPSSTSQPKRLSWPHTRNRAMGTRESTGAGLSTNS